MSNSEIKDILTNRFAEYTISPSENTWSKIEASLEEDAHRRKGIFFWIFDGLAAASILALIGYSIIYSATPSGSQPGENRVATSSTLKNSPIEPHLSIVAISASDAPSSSGSANQNTNQHSYKQTFGSEFIVDNSIKTQHPLDQEIALKTSEVKPKRDNVAPINATLFDVKPLANEIENKLVTTDFSGNKLPRKSRWELGFEATGFLTSKKPVTIAENNGSTWTSTADLVNQPTAKHVRFLELRAFGQRRFGQRIVAGVGISSAFSTSEYVQTTNDAGIMSNYTLSNDYWSLGIPVHAHYAFFQKHRWSISVGGLIQPEFRFTTSTSSQENIPSPEPTALTFSDNKEQNTRTFRLGLQPYLGTDFYATSRMKISFQAGYRSYLLRESALEIKGMDPNYFTATVGASWRI